MEHGFKTFAEVISFAVMREEESHEFYRELAEKTTDPFLQPLFSEFAKEELKHKQMLLDIDAGTLEKMFEKIIEKQDDLGIAKKLENVESNPEMAFADALVLAMKREDKAFELYSLLAEISDDDDLSVLFLGLAKEEEQHRLKIEKTYQAIFDP
ncbi:MAG: ferritin family protein [Desulfobacteraceae bacterium]|nr:ferritin family protein [Desulfobacteraceae bacterium]MBC2756573.1 ferritin family protein [Desulfobacteraceae bacterium]